jgi:hypothetical protein
VDVGKVADISETRAASVFWVEVINTLQNLEIQSQHKKRIIMKDKNR